MLIFGYMGIFIFFAGLFMLVPLLVLIFYPDEITYAPYFVIPGMVCIVGGYVLRIIIKDKKMARLAHHEDTVLVLLVWILTIVVGSLPFLLTGDYDFTRSIFESTSGYTTTGLSIVDVTSAPNIFLFYRSLMQFLGGVGIVLVMTSVISDRYGVRLYHAEGHSDRLMPNLAKSARLILGIYLLYTVLGILAYVISGMPVFDAINHSLAALSTGGFSVKATSIAAYQSLSIEVVTMVLMILGGTNFVVHVFLLRGKWKRVWRHGEFRLLVLLLFLFLPLMIISTMRTLGHGFWQSLREGSFQFLTAVTTTGFSSIESFKAMPLIFVSFVILLMLIGAGFGSTGGAIKQHRVLLMFKSMYWNLRDKMMHSKTIHTNTVNKAGDKVIVTDKDIQNNNVFVLTYLMIFFAGSLVFTVAGHPMVDAMFEFASSLGTVGLSVGLTSTTAPNYVLWTSSAGMLLGRLELYVVLIGLAKMIGDASRRKA